MSARTPAHRHDPGRPQGPPAHKRWSADLSASATVFLIALPLSLGIALACGAPLQAGLVAGAVGGLVCGRLGGAPLQVTGPAAGLTVITAELIQLYGWRTTCALTVAAGLVQVGLGFLRVARAALAVSPAIVHGMLTGIGVTIALAQLHVMLGGDPDSSPVTNALELPGRLVAVQPAALSISGLTVLVLLVWPWLKAHGGSVGAGLGKVPPALAAVGLATAAAWLAGMRLPRVDLPSWRTHALPELPEGPVLPLASAVLTLTLVATIQALLSAVAADKLAAARGGRERVPRSDLDRELRGHGAANVVSGMLGGLPVTGVAVRSAANISAGAVSRNSAMLQGLWVLLAAGLLVGALELIPLAALGALVMVVGVRMVNPGHIKEVSRHGEAPAFWITTAAVVLLGVLEGVAIGVAVAVGMALHRLALTRISVEEGETEARDETEARAEAGGARGVGVHLLVVRGQLTFLAVPRLSRALAQIPEGSRAVVELKGSFMDHAAYEALEGWRATHTAAGGEAEVRGRAGQRLAEPGDSHACTPWTPWRNHQCTRAHTEDTSGGAGAGGAGSARGSGGRHTARKAQLLGGVRNFQRTTAPLVREELARLAEEGQRPSQLFLTCADSRLVTSMITSSGPGDLFTVRNVGNLVPLPGEETGDDSVAAAIEYAVDILKVESVTVCGHSGCGAMQALASSTAQGHAGSSPLTRWLRHGRPSLTRLSARGESAPRIADRETADGTEALCLANIVQQLEHLAAHECVARRVREGALELHGMYFHVGEAQAYVLDLDGTEVAPAVFAAVRPDPVAG
ncbi:SulP family inorganic anion transporter [Streptomyces axinellae]|uniref:SulP family inorganic anion transporter n=1 Tax=Streptomyces axinellae TaxID=552788 RepID=A0ABN3PWT8_9ACTN